MSEADSSSRQNLDGAGKLVAPFCIAFGIASATLLLQLTQTRIYGVMFWNHLVYFIISIALLGFGISGTWLAFGESTPIARRLTRRWAAAGFIVSAVFASFIAPRFGVRYGFVLHSPWQLARLCSTYAVNVTPYFFAGWILGAVYRDWARHIHVLYFGDLAGAAAGCAAYLALMHSCGPVVLVLLCCLLGAAPVFVFEASGVRRWAATAALLLVLGVLRHFQGYFEAGIIPDPSKLYHADYTNLEPGDKRVVEYTEWNPMCRTDVISTLLHPERKWIYIDGDAKTQMVTWATEKPPPFDPAKESMFHAGLPFFLRPNRESALVIGAGGGCDILSALRGGARRIDAVEINPATVRIGLDLYRKQNKEIFHRPGVTLWNEEGRSFVRRSDRRYDNIAIYGIDTFAAVSSGAYMLSENYLYTVEAMKDFIGHLTPTGTLCITRWDYAGEAARLFTVMLEALHQMGIQSPKDHVMAATTSFWICVMVSPAPFTEEEVARVRAHARQYDVKFHYPLPPEARRTPMQRFCNDYASARAANDVSATAEFGRYNVSPVYDDSPFFFHYERARDMLNVFGERQAVDFMRGHGASFTLAILLLLLVAAVTAFMFLPLLRLGRVTLPHFGSWLVYFACLGVAFIFVEIALMQRFALLLGHPSRSLALVLASLLFFAGVGSYLRAFLRVPLGAVLPALAALLLTVAFVYPRLIAATLGQPLWIRGAVTVLMVAPAALLMGMPFPTGIRAVAAHGRGAIPWMWGVNGGTTVLGSILAIVVALYANFTTVLVLAAVGYLLALAMYWRAGRRTDTDEHGRARTNTDEDGG